MRSLASLGDVILSVFASAYVFWVAIVIGWFLGSAIGMGVAAESFQFVDLLGAGAFAFYLALFLPPFYYFNWLALALCLIVGMYTDRPILRVALILLVCSLGFWAGHSLRSAFAG